MPEQEARFFSAQVEVSDERELIPTFAVALSAAICVAILHHRQAKLECSRRRRLRSA
jgi:hypothetical protein